MDQAKPPAAPDEELRAAEERVTRLASLARDVVLVLVKTIKATGIYLPNNPIYKKFHEELQQKFDVYFAEEDRLSLRVNRFELTFLDREVYHNPDKEANIALMFFKDGVREICFHKGIDGSEISGLMEVLEFNQEERALDDDLVTIMWEKDFRNITYTVVEDVASEDTGEEETLLGFEEEPEAIKQIEELRALARRQAAAAPGGAATAGQGAEAALQDVPLHPGRLAEGGPDEGAQDFESIRGTYTAPDDIALLTELTDIFYEIMVTESDMVRFGTVADSLAKALDIFVSRGDLALATVLVMKVQELAGSERLSEPARHIIDGVLARAASDTLVKKVGQYIEETGQGALEAAGSYLSQLDHRAVGPMVVLLETMSDRKARRALCDIIPVAAGGAARLLTPHLRHRIWYVARNVAMMLGRMKDAEAVRPLGAALKHTEPRVRKEAVAALSMLGGKEAVGFIESALEDEARAVRAAAARALSETSPERAFARLTEIVSRKEFRAREFDEKREMLELTGKTGGERSVEMLSGIFAKKGLLGGGKDEMRVCAAYGLAAAGGERALGLLKTELGSKHSPLRAACSEGVRLIEARRG